MRYTFAILILAAVVGCSNPKNTKIPQDLSKIDAIKASVEKLTPEEKELFGGYLMMHMMGTAPGTPPGVKPSPIPEGTTIGKAIEEQRAFIKDARPEFVAQKLRKGKEVGGK